jgi:hypothetical protein
MYLRAASETVLRGTAAEMLDGRVSAGAGRLWRGLPSSHLNQGRMSGAHVFADFDGRALAAAARTEVVGCSFDRNRTMIPRELHVDEGKLAVTRVDACDESVMGHIRFPRKARKIHV